MRYCSDRSRTSVDEGTKEAAIRVNWLYSRQERLKRKLGS